MQDSERDDGVDAALHDDRTGLPGRVLLRDRLGQALARAQRADEPVAVLVLGLDGLAVDGEAAATEEVAADVADRIQALLRRPDTVARLAPAEFGLLLGTDGDRTGALTLAERIEHELMVAGRVNGAEADEAVAVAIGVAVSPDDGTDADVLLARAGAAMGRAARDGGGVRPWSEAEESATSRRLGLLRDLRGAVDRGEITVSFQPVMDITTDRVVGVEALGRWNHPTFGLVPTDEWVALAEASGTIGVVTVHVLDRTLATLRRLEEHGHTLRAAVNVSVLDLVDPEVMGQLAACLERYGLPGDRLVVEVTETEVMDDAERATAALVALGGLGIRRSLDDFGTGHSSLARLRTLPLDELKIDRSFVTGMHRDPEAEVYVRTILDLARTLGLEVVAEGVEDETVLAQLRALGCQLVQGHHLARPLAPDELVAWLSTRSAGSPVDTLGP